MKIVAYYTPNKIYTPFKEQFEKDLTNLNLDYYIEPVELNRKWIICAKYRPTFLLRMLDIYGTILSLDVDCRVYRNPIITLEKDIAMHWLDWPGRTKVYLAGTMYLTKTNNTVSILKEWERRCKKDKRRSGHILTSILKERNTDIQLLDVRYAKCRFMDLDNIVIEHYNAGEIARGKPNS
jgi:hypothetical protein